MASVGMRLRADSAPFDQEGLVPWWVVLMPHFLFLRLIKRQWFMDKMLAFPKVRARCFQEGLLTGPNNQQAVEKSQPEQADNQSEAK